MGFQIPWAVFQIPQGKNVGILLESGFPFIGRDSSELLRSFSLSLFVFALWLFSPTFTVRNWSLRITLCYRRYGKTIIIGVFWNPAIEQILFVENLSYPQLFAIQTNFRQKYNFTKCFYSSKPKTFNINLIYTFCLDAKRGLI